jgi:hypothetical protein
MQPELYFFEQWLRERHANIRADVRAARLRPQLDCAAREVDPNGQKDPSGEHRRTRRCTGLEGHRVLIPQTWRDFLWRARHVGMSPVARGALYGGAYLFKIGAFTVGGGLTIALSATRFMLPTRIGRRWDAKRRARRCHRK